MRRHPYPALVGCSLALVVVLVLSGIRLQLWLLALAVALSSVLVVVSGGRRWLGASLFVLPLLVAVPWIVDKGDNDGLWVLWFPFVVVMIPATATASAVVTRLRK